MSWFIQDGVNNGYPALDVWLPSWTTGWTSNDNIRLPDYTWRIKAGVNNGYPWIYWWFREGTSTDGEMVIGGSQTNYPNGFTPANRGGIRDDFDNLDMRIGNTGGIFATGSLAGAMHGRAFIIDYPTFTAIVSKFNDSTIFTEATYVAIANLYGANVFDSVLSCKVYPFDLSFLSNSVISGYTGDVKAFGAYTLLTNVPLMGDSLGYYNFPTITVTPLQAWEIENIDFSIYLPMSGVYPLDIRGESDVDVRLNVDLVDGTGEYYVFINQQLVGVYRVLLGADIPINTNQGRMQANMLTNVLSSFGKVAGTMTDMYAGNNIASTAINPILPTEHFAMNTPAVGGLASMYCYGDVRVLAKIPKMFRDGYGYFETLGANRSTTYVRLSDCSGYIQCKNYKTDIIVATDTEKAEIERLMNEGVFI